MADQRHLGLSRLASGGNGDVALHGGDPAEFGAPTSLDDFERKAQMMNYVYHRAIFEGMNAHLWTPTAAGCYG